MSKFPLLNSILALHNKPWIEGMVVDELSDIIADPTRFEGRLVYVKNKIPHVYVVGADLVPKLVNEEAFTALKGEGYENETIKGNAEAIKQLLDALENIEVAPVDTTKRVELLSELLDDTLNAEREDGNPIYVAQTKTWYYLYDKTKANSLGGWKKLIGLAADGSQDSLLGSGTGETGTAAFIDGGGPDSDVPEELL